MRVCNENKEAIIEDIRKKTHIDITLDEQGIIIKADTIGSLEALIKESRDHNVEIRKAEIGHVSKRDITEADATNNQLQNVIFAFNVKTLPAAKDELKNTKVTVFNKDVIYTILEDYDDWLIRTKESLERSRRVEFVHPGMIKILPEFIFRISNPAVFGVRVLSGRIKQDIKLMREDGRTIGRIKGIQLENQAVEEAKQGAEVAVSVDGVTIGRQIKGGDILYTDIPEADAKKLKSRDVLNIDENDVLQKIIEIKRKIEKFWGM